jgi:hypothetical protein
MKSTSPLVRVMSSLAVATVIAVAFFSTVSTVPQLGATTVAAQTDPNASAELANQFANVILPPDMGQTTNQVYVSATGHTVQGQMLDYWRANGAASVYGNPISEPFAAPNGYYSQAFEAGVFQFLPEYLWTEDPDVRLMPISNIVLNHRVGNMRRDGKRAYGGGDSRTHPWRWVDPAGSAAQRAINAGGIYASDTGHTITDEMLAWFNDHEGWFYLGDPLSQQVRERGVTVQYFEGGLLMRDSEGTMSLAPVAKENAKVLGLKTRRVERGNLPEFDEGLFMTSPNPSQWGDIYAPGRKRIEVSISEQTLWAYHGDTLVSQTLVSTGLAPNNTELGIFHVRYKKEKETMSGFTNATGEVVGLGDGSGQQTGERYEVKDIPHVMYINSDAEALHGAYWHNNFGNRMSHGCINLPLDFAAFLYGWAPLGTEVRVYE